LFLNHFLPKKGVVSRLLYADNLFAQDAFLVGFCFGGRLRVSDQKTLTEEEANELVVEHHGWAESIARAVARGWNMDWRLDGLDGAAMEALIFCSRRFDPSRGIPFKGYARKRIHEAATDAARKSKGWTRGVSNSGSAEAKARELSAELYGVFPELREGRLPIAESSGNDDADMRSAVRELLVGASIVASRQAVSSDPQPDELVDYKRMVTVMAVLEPVHQWLLYRVYWDGLSLRTVASEWETDGLNVMREHKVLLTYLQKSMAAGKPTATPKVRPGLKELTARFKREGSKGPFSDVLHTLN
jgi:DNA-directed RNA polymerase specialized sigma subunit